MHAAPELASSTTYDIKANAAALTEPHQDQVAVRAALRVIAHLRRAIQCTLVCALAPPFAAVHGSVFNVLVPAGFGCTLRVELVAYLGHCRYDMARIWGGRAAKQEVVKLLAITRLQRFVLRAVLELGADSERAGGKEPGEGEGPSDHGVCCGRVW